MSPSEARQAARRSFGGVDQIRETCHDLRGLRWLDDLRSDLRFGLRGLARNPGFTASAHHRDSVVRNRATSAAVRSQFSTSAWSCARPAFVSE